MGWNAIPRQKRKNGLDTQRVRLPLRVTLGTGENAVVYEWLPFDVIRAGTEEMELASSGEFPFRMSIVFGGPDLLRGKVDFK